MKKILFFTPGLDIGGIEKVFVTYANFLVEHNYKVYYSYCHDKGKLEKVLSTEVVRCPLGSKRLMYSLPSLISLLNHFHPDYLITGGDYSNCLAIIASSFVKGTKCIISHHSYFNVETNKAISTFMIRTFYNRAYRVISVSQGITELLISLGVKDKVIETIYNPLDINQILRDSTLSVNCDIKTIDYLVFVGRLSAVKNLKMMLEAFKIVLSKKNSLKLLIVGEGAESDKLKEYCCRLKIDDSVRFLGATSNPYPYMKYAQLVLLSSLSEALPTVILESFALRKTVVSTPTEGAKDLLQLGHCGYLSSDIQNSEAFANTILLALEERISEDLLLQRAEDFSIAKQAELFSRILK